MRQALQAVDRILPGLGERGAAGEQPFLAVDLQRRDAGGAGGRVAGISIAVEQLDLAFRAVHERIMHLAARKHRAHRDRAVGQALGGRDEIGHDAEIVDREGRAEPAEAGNDLVEDQEDAVPVTNGAQALQIAFRRDQHAGRAGHRLDDDGGDGLGAMQRDEAFQVVGKLGAMLRLALGIGVAREVVGVAQMVRARQLRKDAAVGHDAADRNAAEADAVIAALAADEPGARALADGALVGEGDLQRGIDRFRAGAGEEHPVELGGRPARRDAAELLGEVEGDRVAHLERGREVEGRKLAFDGGGDAPAAVAGIDAPEAGSAVAHGAAVDARIVHALGRGEHPRCRLELAVGGERHPVIGKAGAVGRRMGVHQDPPRLPPAGA